MNDNNLAPFDDFRADKYLLHNQRRFEHLDSLELNFAGKSIFEVGAGIGDHTEHLLTKGISRILTTEAREENFDILKQKFLGEQKVEILKLNLEEPHAKIDIHDICYCYGLLYHLSQPESAIAYLSDHTGETLLIETCVDYLKQDTVNLISEDARQYSQSYSGIGCRPGRRWLFNILKSHFEYVYVPRTQPSHEQFPLDWSLDEPPARLTRAIFVASRTKLNNEKLSPELLYQQSKLV